MTKNFVDHYLQAEILARLAEASRPLRFSELKEDGIENSLFMYHANKLIARGAVQKTDEGFTLTAAGAQWMNLANMSMMSHKPTPRLLVQFVIRYGDEVLLSRRVGQLKELLNEYLLPGGLHKLGISADENASVILQRMLDGSTNGEYLGVVENIVDYAEFTSHSMAHVYLVELAKKITPPAEDRFEFEWVPISAVSDKDNQFLTQFFKVLDEGGLKEINTFRSR